MSLKQEIETWVQALGHYDNNEYEEALKIFDNIADTSKILFNCGVIHATLGEHDRAVECYQRAIQLDQYLAVAYFQQGVSNFLVGDFEEALANFNDTLLYLRGNNYIDYDQLGLKFRLYSCEVLFNRGLCYIYLQQEKPGMQDFGYAVKEKMTADHDVIDDAIREKAEGYTVFSIPVGVVYRPNDAKVKNLKAKDYLGKARLIATSTALDTSTGFSGFEQKLALANDKIAKDDRPAESISYAASNLVQRNLSSRVGREQSAPPTIGGRNLFPPTPPPEADKPAFPTRTSSFRSGGSRAAAPVRQDYEITPVESSSEQQRAPPTQESNITLAEPFVSPIRSHERNQLSWPTQVDRSRLGTTRTASEPRGQLSRNHSYQSSTYSRSSYRPMLFRETTPQRPTETTQDEDTREHLYDMYHYQPQPTYASKNTDRRAVQQPQYIDEEDEYVDQTPVDDSSRFDAISITPFGQEQRRGDSVSGSSAGKSRRPEMTKIRVKVHANDDTRYMMIGATIDFGGFESKIREKFNITSRLKIKMEDDGDMITMADQDDLDLLLGTVLEVARKERSEMGKMEVWIQEIH